MISYREVLKAAKMSTISHRAARALLTGGYTCGLLALGERNDYLFPARWITVDWTHADINVWIDPSFSLPLSNNSQNIVYAAHILEHLPDNVLSRALIEVHRVLRGGGCLRLEVPDTHKLVAALVDNDRHLLDRFRENRAQIIKRLDLGPNYLEDHLTVLGEVSNYNVAKDHAYHVPVYATREQFEMWLDAGIEVLNERAQALKTPAQRMSGGHNNALYFSKIQAHLLAAGFSRIETVNRGVTHIPDLRFSRTPIPTFRAIYEKPYRQDYSLYIEAFK